MDATEYLEAVTDCQNLASLWDMHCQRMASYGFTRLFYGYTRYRTSGSLGDPSDFIVLSNFDPSYAELFMGGGHYQNGPMVRWALENEGAASWADVLKTIHPEKLSNAEREVIAINRRLGLNAGYTISFKSVSARSKGAIGMTGDVGVTQDELDACWQKYGREIKLINNVVHLKIITLPHQTPSRTLTNRQLEALQWVGDGKTMQDIATIMGLTQATVEKHLRRAREALNVDTTAQAVLKASLLNQMYILSGE